MNVKGQAAIVTGGASGLGGATASALLCTDFKRAGQSGDLRCTHSLRVSSSIQTMASLTERNGVCQSLCKTQGQVQGEVTTHEKVTRTIDRMDLASRHRNDHVSRRSTAFASVITAGNN